MRLSWRQASRAAAWQTSFQTFMLSFFAFMVASSQLPVSPLRLWLLFLLQPSDPRAKDENAFFIRINKFSKSRGGDAGGEESDAATDDGEGEGDRRH
jgi:hypothetical protein